MTDGAAGGGGGTGAGFASLAAGGLSSTVSGSAGLRDRRSITHPAAISASRGTASHHAPHPCSGPAAGGETLGAAGAAGTGVTSGIGATSAGRATGVADGTGVGSGAGWEVDRGVGDGDGRTVGSARSVARGLGVGRTGDGRLTTGGGGVGTGLGDGVGVGVGLDGRTSGAVIASSRVGGTSCAARGVASGTRARAAVRKRIALPIAGFHRHASGAATKRAAPATGRARPAPL